jgi:hypothetical protein
MLKKGFLAYHEVLLGALLISKTSRSMGDASTHGDLRAVLLSYKLRINMTRVQMTSHRIRRHEFRHMMLVLETKRQRRSSRNVVGLGLRQRRTRRRLMSPSNSEMRHSSQRLSAKVRCKIVKGFIGLPLMQLHTRLGVAT